MSAPRLGEIAAGRDVETAPEEEVIPSPSWRGRRWRHERATVGDDESGDRTQFIAWFALGGIVLLGWAVQLAGWLTVFPLITPLVLALAVAGLGTIAFAWSGHRRSRRTVEKIALVGLALVIVTLAVWTFLQTYSTPGYLADELAFDQYAAHLLLHGLNPYTHSMAPSFAQFHVGPDNYTFRLNGTPVTSLSYPSMAFLVYVPFLFLGWSTELAVALNVVALGASVTLIHFVLPRELRPLAIVIGSAAVYVGYAVGGVTDVLFVPLLIGAAIAWDRYPRLSGWRSWVGPVLLGLAMGIKQQPWLILPFIVAGIYLEARRDSDADAPTAALRTAGRYAAIALATLLIPNIPFIILSPSAWFNGVLTPFAAHAVPAGQGVVGLTLFMGVGGGSLVAYSVAALCALIALLVVYVVTYPVLKPVTFLVPVVALFLSSRSFGSYLVALVPAALVAALTTSVWGMPKVSRRALGAALVVTVLAVGALAVALIVPAPLTVRVVSVETTGQLATVDHVQVLVANHSGRALSPAFSVQTGTTLTSFWLRQGPTVLAPHSSANYNLYAPDFDAQPPISGGFQVVAFTDSPATVSRAPTFRPTTDHVELSPDAFEQPIVVGRPVTITGQLVDQFDRSVHRAGVPIYLGQVIYAQQGLLYGETVINGGPPGQSPVIVDTDVHGQAVFTIVATIATSDPVYFEANLVNNTNFYPYGYSQIVPVRFVAGP